MGKKKKGRGEETVSVHIRRGDLVAEKGTILSLSYYERAVEQLGRVRDMCIYICSLYKCVYLIYIVYVHIYRDIYIYTYPSPYLGIHIYINIPHPCVVYIHVREYMHLYMIHEYIQIYLCPTTRALWSSWAG